MGMRLLAVALAAATCGVAFVPAIARGPADYRIVDRIAGSDGYWDYANVDPVAGRLYVARGDAIERVDLATRQVTGSLAPAHRAHQVLPIDNGATIVETDGETGKTRFVAAGDGKLIAEVATGRKPDAAFYDPATGFVAVMNGGDGTVALIDPNTHALADRIMVGGSLEFGVADGKGGAFVNIEDANAIARIDLKARRRTGTINLPGCDGPTGLALVANGTRLISACANKVALVIDAVSGKALATLTIGADPDAVLVDAARDLAFIPCGGSGTLIALSIANPDAIAVVRVIPTQRGAKTGAIDPRDGRIYLPTATLAPTESGAKRGRPLPGSYTILVLAPAQKGAKANLQYLDEASFAPAKTLPAPAAADSAVGAVELKRVHALIDGADAARRAQAKTDAEIEDPTIFDAAAGRRLETLPNSWALLTLIQSEAALAADLSKQHFNRVRPWGIDPSIHSCEAAEGKKPLHSYPSGHASLAFSVGWTLSQLLPDRASAILDRASDYALSREICGEHFASDTEASHVTGTLAAWSLLHDPRLSGLIEATRTELAAQAGQ